VSTDLPARDRPSTGSPASSAGDAGPALAEQPVGQPVSGYPGGGLPVADGTPTHGAVSGDGNPPGGGTAGGGGEGSDGAPAPKRSARRWIVEWVVIVLVAVGVAFGVRTYVAQTYYVPSTSMWPTLKAGDRIVVNKLSGAPSAGDIIVFKRPPAENCGGAPVPDLVKRVVGLPGQTVSAHAGQVYVTGKLLNEPWLPKDPHTYTTMTGSYTVPKGDYYVMGDNRTDSCDSRMWGPVKGSSVVGQVFLILWPPSRFRFF